MRIATSNCHDRLHYHPITCPLVHHEVTLRDYAITLFAFEKFYENLAQEASKIDHNFSLDQILRIQRDLLQLGFDKNPFEDCQYISLPPDKDALWGLLYVTEGSRLGGQQISKNIQKVLGLKINNGNSFFGSEKKFSSKDWKEFIFKMSCNVKDHQQCVKSAKAVFLGLEGWLWDVHNKQIKTVAG